MVEITNLIANQFTLQQWATNFIVLLKAKYCRKKSL